MRTPFSDYTFSNPNNYTSIGNAFELESPLLDPGELEYENVELEKYSYDRYIREDSEVINIDVQKAILFNKKYQSELWGSQVSSITKYFASISITKDGLPLDANNFAIAVAKWQATVFTNPKSIDGALGPVSWNLLKSRINAIPAPTTTPTITRSRWHSIITNTVSSPAIPLVHGKETFRQMVAAIKTATSSDHYIYILGWMLDVDFEMIPGDKSSTLIQLLQDASKRNVEIRVLIWDSPLYIKEISNATTKINSLNNAVLIKDNATFGSPGIKSAISKIRFLISQAPLFLRFISSWNDFVAKANTIQNEGSHHEKVLVVKGKEGLIGFCGGIDINPNRVKGVDSLGRSTVLHDIHCEVRGHAAWVLLHRFIWRWQIYKSRASWPPPKLLLVPLLGDKEPLPAAAVPGANVAQVKILQTYNHPGNNIKDRSIREAVKLAIFNAKKSVHIEDQYMISLEIASWLNNKLANEPNFSSVTILTQDDDIAGEDILFPKQMRKKFIDQLVNGLSVVNRKKIFIQMLHRSAPLTAHHKIHSKIYIIDDELAIIGSANLSSRSMTHDSETAAIIFNDPGASTNFALQLKAKMKADPDTNIISYTPNPNVKDIDVKVIDELNNLSTAKRIALAATFGPTFTLLIPQVIKTLLTQLKPALIDIIDPDADNTQPQQELEGWPETLQENNMYNESVEQEAALEELFIPSENESLENYQSEDNLQNEDETNGDYAQLEHGAEDLTFYNEQTTYVNDSYEEINNGYFPSENETAEMIENQVAIINSKPCVGLICWAKDALNKFLNVNLTINNKLDEATKKAIGDFQVKNNLPQTQKIDPTTERSLLEVDAIRRHKGTALDQVATKTITEAKKKIEDFTKKAINNKPQHILNSYRDPRKVYAFVLHHMAFKRTGTVSKQYCDPSAYLSTGAHFCIMLDGRIIQLHAMSRMIWHGNCISPGSVAVEFEGNFPNIKGTWWYPTDKKTGKKIKVNEDKPTQAQFDSGRFLACYLKLVLGTTHILAHRQSSDSRENDPGPDIWFNVGQWAVDKLGLSDGGPTFKCGTGKPILPEWKTWGNKAVHTNEFGEYNEKTEDAEWQSEDENFSHDFTIEPEVDYESDLSSDENSYGESYPEMEDLLNDLPNAVTKNRYYADKLGWNQHQDQINDFLLPYSGQQNVSLGEEAFAEAVAAWQQQQGFAAKDCDGIIGPNTWQIMKLIIKPGNYPKQQLAKNADSVSSSFGKLKIDLRIGALSKCYPEYQFTPVDALWLARFVEGEAGGQNNPDSHAVIWAMFNRFSTVRHRVPSWTSFSVFLQKYSTTLQPMLNSVGAAERVWDNYKRNPKANPIVEGNEYYPGTNIKKVQYLRHKKLQQKKWDEFPSHVRNMVAGILNGRILNPGIGIATHFLSTYILLKANRRKQGIKEKPSNAEWLQYTQLFAQNKKLIWIGEKANLNQQKNAFFIQPEFRNVPSDAVKVEPGGIEYESPDYDFRNETEYLEAMEEENVPDFF